MITKDELKEWCKENGLPSYRADQIYGAVTKDLISSWDESSNLPKDLRDFLKENLPISSLQVKETQESKDKDTMKIAFETHDGKVIESVLMRHEDDRNTVCISTQIGCPMNCLFCATGKMGFIRNLTPEEIVDQVLEFSRILKKEEKTVTNVVVMGMGEPFLNYENTLKAIKILNDQKGVSLGARHITVSTSGILPGIRRFADEELQVNLAISLHAPNNEIRDQLMPVNNQYPIETLLKEVSNYMKKTKRKVFFEYILFDGINDSAKNARDLAKLLKKNLHDQMHLTHVNLIEYNKTEGNDLVSPGGEKVREFFDILKKEKILATTRHRFGTDISAACGQLAGK